MDPNPPLVPQALLDSQNRLISFAEAHRFLVTSVSEEISNRPLSAWDSASIENKDKIEVTISVHLAKTPSVHVSPEKPHGSLVQSTFLEGPTADPAPADLAKSEFSPEFIDALVKSRIANIFADLMKNASPEEQKKLNELSKSVMKEMSSPEGKAVLKSHITKTIADPAGMAKSRLQAALSKSQMPTVEVSQVIGAYLTNHRNTIITELYHDFFEQVEKSAIIAKEGKKELEPKAQDLIANTLQQLSSNTTDKSVVDLDAYTEQLAHDYIKTHFTVIMKGITSSAVQELAKSHIGKEQLNEMIKSKINDFVSTAGKSQLNKAQK